MKVLISIVVLIWVGNLGLCTGTLQAGSLLVINGVTTRLNGRK